MKQILTYIIIFFVFGSLHAQEDPDLMGLDSTVDSTSQTMYNDHTVSYPNCSLDKIGPYSKWHI